MVSGWELVMRKTAHMIRGLEFGAGPVVDGWGPWKLTWPSCNAPCCNQSCPNNEALVNAGHWGSVELPVFLREHTDSLQWRCALIPQRVQKLCLSSQTLPHLPSVFIWLILIWILYGKTNYKASPAAQMVKASTYNAGDLGFHPWVGKIPWRRKWHPHSSTLAWKIPWTEEPGGLQSMGWQRVRHDWATSPSPSNSFSLWGSRVLQLEKRLRSAI